MTKRLNQRIQDAFDTIYNEGDYGLDYMDGHVELDEDLLDHFYNNTVETLSIAEQERMAEMLENIVEDMEFHLHGA